MVAPVPDAVARQVLAGVAGFRVLAWAWLAVVAGAGTPGMRHPAVAWALVGGAGVVAVGLLVVSRTRPAVLGRPVVLAVDAAVAGALVVADGFVHELGRSQSLAGALPVAPVLAVAVVLGARPVPVLALAYGAGRFASSVGLDGDPSGWRGGTWMSVATAVVLYALAGLVAAGVARRLRLAEDEVAFARARERVALDLHDGMLQTLAAVQRRAGDDALVRLARSQEAELRHYLSGPGPRAGAAGREPEAPTTTAALRRVVATATARHDLRIDVALVEPLPDLDGERAAAVAGAVGEALANVARHAGVARATVFAEASGDGGLTCTVRDDGCGFDPGAVERRGLRTSVADRLSAVGGTLEVRSAPGEGCELVLQVPAARTARRAVAR